MSRARVHEVSSPISLFPFIGILLCTMGALLVVLVAVSRSARDTAERQVHEKQKSAKSAIDEGLKKKMADVERYVGELGKIRGEAERKLRDEHARLSHVEDHIRRLQEKFRSLEIAARELDALEKEHYDDREQAERETARLHELIENSRNTIADLQGAAEKEPTSYALVPYEGPNGTFRRPIYVECVKDGVILQPEDVRLSAGDLRPPYGAGNPLAAALRACRDHYIKLHPKEGQSRDSEPYPLLLVRPQGLYMFDRARQAIEAGDFDLGFELVEEDWSLKYPQADPQLASVEQVAIDQARVRQEVLAAAAPRAYRSGGYSFSDPYGTAADDDGEVYADGGDFGGDGEDRYASGGGRRSPNGGTDSGDGGGNSRHGYFDGSGGGPGGGQSFGGGGSGSGGSGAGGSGSEAKSGEDGHPGNVSGATANGASMAGGGGGGGAGSGCYGGSPYNDETGGSGNSGNSDAITGSGSGRGSSTSMSSGGSMSITATADPNAPPDASGGSQNVSVMTGSPPPDDSRDSDYDSRDRRHYNHTLPPDKRAKDWALRQKPQRAVAVRRTIRVVVRKDQLAILPDGARDPSLGKAIPLEKDTVQSIDEFVKHVHDQIDGWGMAGNGLYWRPVIVLSVGPEGQGRANDLARLLRNSGLELRNDETARNAPQGKPNETR